MPWSDADLAEYDPPDRMRQLPSWLVGRLSASASGLVTAALEAEGLRRQHFTVLSALAERGAASQAALGRRLLIDRSDMHALLRELERDGLVTRLRDPNDRRRMLVDLTPAGARALKRLDRRIEAAQEAFMAPLSASDRRVLQRLLTQLLEYHSHGA
ncbi:MAG TPA: MarR family transcriptional regulator [Solirubrobacteraceae bacterium]|nr:MarR family transcriptional regulator [Solirubrobacteraceae bacterium]